MKSKIKKKMEAEAIRRCTTKDEYLTDFGVSCFMDGANWMREELTRWRDPKKEMPDVGTRTLAIVTDETRWFPVMLDFYRSGWWIKPSPTDRWVKCPYEVLKWKYIH